MADKEEKPKTRGTRLNDDLQLLKLILDENQPLRERVLKLIERTIGINSRPPKS